MDAIRIVLVEDDRVVRAAIATLLTRESDLEVVGELGHVEVRRVEVGFDQAGHDGAAPGVDPGRIRHGDGVPVHDGDAQEVAVHRAHVVESRLRFGPRRGGTNLQRQRPDDLQVVRGWGRVVGCQMGNVDPGDRDHFPLYRAHDG